jgi:hypothetical protein
MAPSPPTPGARSRSFSKVADQHAQGNRRSRDDWELYAEHRRRLTATILEVTSAEARTLCLLGAGNCNDVDLEQLAARFTAIHLVDIDAAALDRARARQTPEVRARLHAHGGVDLTGMLAQLDGGAGKGRAALEQPAALEQATAAGVAAVMKALAAAGAACDLAVSCCLMSQLGWSLDTALGAPAGARPGDADSASIELRLAALTVHLRTLAALARPGGAALLASDIVSSDLYPLDDLEPGTDLAALAEALIAGQQVVYAGANPLLTARLLRRDSVLKDAFAAPVARPPWLWTGQFERTYLVYPQLLLRR